MSAIPHQKLAQRKRRILNRIAHCGIGPDGGPVMGASNIHYDLAERSRGLVHGGIGLIHDFAKKIGLVEAIDRRLQILKLHLPYHESDHVLNIAYNALCDGTCLDDIELRRNDEVFLDALGANGSPIPLRREISAVASNRRTFGPCKRPSTKFGSRSGATA